MDITTQMIYSARARCHARAVMISPRKPWMDDAPRARRSMFDVRARSRVPISRSPSGAHVPIPIPIRTHASCTCIPHHCVCFVILRIAYVVLARRSRAFRPLEGKELSF